jgi:hypothetical protein
MQPGRLESLYTSRDLLLLHFVFEGGEVGDEESATHSGVFEVQGV